MGALGGGAWIERSSREVRLRFRLGGETLRPSSCTSLSSADFRGGDDNADGGEDGVGVGFAVREPYVRLTREDMVARAKQRAKHRAAPRARHVIPLTLWRSDGCLSL